VWRNDALVEYFILKMFMQLYQPIQVSGCITLSPQRLHAGFEKSIANIFFKIPQLA